MDEPEDKGGGRSKVDKSESEADADEETSSRESSQRPNTRKSEGGIDKNILKLNLKKKFYRVFPPSL